MAQKKNTAEKVRELIEPAINELGYAVWDVDYSKIGTERHLEITIDSEKGIDISDCEKVHRVIEVIIDEADPIEEMYYLDVSSPGLERVIRTKEHFEKCIGETVELKLFAAVNGKKSIIAHLTAYEPESDTVTVTEKNGNIVTLERKQISKANVYFEF
jgi:ribosome maturation factor RimP